MNLTGIHNYCIFIVSNMILLGKRSDIDEKNYTTVDIFDLFN